MDHDHIVSELLRKYTELAGELAAARKEQRRVGKLMADVCSILAIYRPTMQPRAMRARRPHPQPHGEHSKAAMVVLRSASEPLLTREIAERVLRQRGEPNPDQRMIGLLVPTIGMALGNWKRKGLVSDNGSQPKRWALAKIGPTQE